MSRALERLLTGWNREGLDLESDESLAQVLDRGGLDAWRELFALARRDPLLRARLTHLVYTVPLPYPRFWLAALASVGAAVDWTRALPEDRGPA